MVCATDYLINFLGKGPFASWFEMAKTLGVEERSDCLFKNKEMAEAHLKCAESGETQAPPADKVQYHFIAYLNRGGRLLEFGLFFKTC